MNDVRDYRGRRAEGAQERRGQGKGGRETHNRSDEARQEVGEGARQPGVQKGSRPLFRGVGEKSATCRAKQPAKEKHPRRSSTVSWAICAAMSHPDTGRLSWLENLTLSVSPSHTGKGSNHAKALRLIRVVTNLWMPPATSVILDALCNGQRLRRVGSTAATLHANSHLGQVSLGDTDVAVQQTPHEP